MADQPATDPHPIDQDQTAPAVISSQPADPQSASGPTDLQTSLNSPLPERRKSGWLHRQSVRELLREAAEPREYWKEWDARDNTNTRLPATEEIHFGGVALSEAFTPSTISALYEAIRNLPSQRPEKKQEWIDELTKRRSPAGGGGWRTLGLVRHPGDSIMSDGFQDATLPEDVDAVWLHLGYPTSSVAVVGATFTIKEKAGDLSEMLRADYQSRVVEPYMVVRGRFGSVRAKIPWARPLHQGVGYKWHTPDQERRLAVESMIGAYEDACWEWLVSRFSGGRFNAEPRDNRPTVRFLFTKEQIPYSSRSPHLDAVGLSFSPRVFRSVDVPGWAMNFDQWPSYERRRFSVVAAARRQDIARDPTPTDPGDSLWDLTQKFHYEQSMLLMPWVVSCLLSVYIDRLGELRDRAGGRRRFKRPVTQAIDLDRYLLGDGLDAVTIASDARRITEKLVWFRRGIVEHTEDLSFYPPDYQRKPSELVPDIRTNLRWRSKQILRDAAKTTENIRASAELRQAIANTRLQRTLLVLAVVALALATISIAISLNASG